MPTKQRVCWFQTTRIGLVVLPSIKSTQGTPVNFVASYKYLGTLTDGNVYLGPYRTSLKKTETKSRDLF